MQMMIETQEMKEAEYTPVTIEVQGLEGLRRLVDQLPDGTVYSIDLEVVSDGQET